MSRRSEEQDLASSGRKAGRLPAGDGMRDVASGAFARVCAAGAPQRASGVRSPTAGKAGPEDGTERRRAGEGDPDGAVGESVPGRGSPEGEGAACGQGDPGRQEPGAPADEGARTAGAGAAGASLRRPELRRPDPDREGRDELWGTDASRFWTRAEGWCWFFGAIDHCASDVVAWHVANKGDRCAALEPVRQGRPGPHGRLRQGHRSGPRSAARLGLAVPGQAVPGRDQMARHLLDARLRG